MNNEHVKKCSNLTRSQEIANSSRLDVLPYHFASSSRANMKTNDARCLRLEEVRGREFAQTAVKCTDSGFLLENNMTIASKIEECISPSTQ